MKNRDYIQLNSSAILICSVTLAGCSPVGIQTKVFARAGVFPADNVVGKVRAAGLEVAVTAGLCKFLGG